MLAGSGCTDDASNGLTGSTDSTDVVKITADMLDGRTFVSTEVQGRNLVVGTSVTLSFDGTTLSSGAGCNSMGGGFEVVGGALVTGSEWAGTMKGCPPDLAEQDEWLTAFLTASPKLSVDGDSLTLSAPEVSMTLLDSTA